MNDNINITDARVEQDAMGNVESIHIEGTVLVPGVQRRVVCAANRYKQTGRLVVGPRHFDATMRATMAWVGLEDFYQAAWEQGFIDQWGMFMTREEAWIVAKAAGQIMRRCGGDEGCLYSENLY